MYPCRTVFVKTNNLWEPWHQRLYNITSVLIIVELSTHSISINVNFMNGDEVIETWVDDKL